MCKTIYFGVQKNRKMSEEDFRDYADSIQKVTGRVTEVKTSDNSRPGNNLELFLDGEKIGSWGYLPMLGHSRGNYLIAH
jgi:hypothetical protein